MSIRSALMRCIYDGNIADYQSMIDSVTTLDQIQNIKGTNILHDLANSTVSIMIYYLKVINTLPMPLIQEMLLSKSSEKDDQTPLQLSISFNKKWRALAFIHISEDLSIKDDHGRSLIHLSVRNNNILLLVSLLEKGLNINELDNFSNTCLHIAISERYTEMALALIELGADINIQGEGQNTALHLAVRFDDYRVVRRLIIRGVDKNVVNDEGNKAVDMEMTNEIRQLFGSGFLCEKHQFVKNPAYAWALVCTFVVKFLLLWFINLEKMQFGQLLMSFPDYVYFIFIFLVFIGNICFFLISSFKNPGFTEKTHVKLSTLLTKHKPESICISCRNIKHKETYHCSICNHCVSNYDHHCKWINNCVGHGNIVFFTAFLIFSLADLFIGFLAGPKMLIRNSSYSTLTSISQIISITLCGIMILIISPIAFMQVTNLINATTTSDRFSKKSKSSSFNSSVLRNSFIDATFED